MQRDKKVVISELGKGHHLIEAAAKIKRDPATIWRWRQQDPEFDATVREFCEENEEARVSAVEEVLYLRILQGKASPPEIIFYLTNRARTRWKNKHSQEHLGADGEPMDHIPLSQLQAIAAKIDTVKIDITADMAAELMGLRLPRVEEKREK